jgi:AraC family transcriptional regulator
MTRFSLRNVAASQYLHIRTLNVHAERSRLPPEQVARWRGLPIGWFDAGAAARHRHFVAGRRLALLDAGAAQARFDFGAGAQTFELGGGAMGLFDGRACKLSEWSCRSVRRIMVDLEGAGFDDEPEAALGLRQDLHFHDDELAGVLRAMVREVAEGCLHGTLYAESLSASVLLRLQTTHGPHAQRERGTLTAAQLRRVDEVIAEHIDNGPTLADLASAAGYSKAHFVRLFRRSTGTSPHRYVLLHRLEQARELIVGSALPLAEVASATGFASQSHLNSAFVRLYRCTPGDARREAGR